MYVITAYKPSMHVYNEIGLYGTAKQMKVTQDEWTGSGNKPKPRNFTAICGVNPSISPDKWLDIPRTHRDWCRDHSHSGTHYCDYDPELSEEAISTLEALKQQALESKAPHA
jgi:hypothetical protein